MEAKWEATYADDGRMFLSWDGKPVGELYAHHVADVPKIAREMCEAMNGRASHSALVAACEQLLANCKSVTEYEDGPYVTEVPDRFVGTLRRALAAHKKGEGDA